jgi:hypothetical protein
VTPDQARVRHSTCCRSSHSPMPVSPSARLRRSPSSDYPAPVRLWSRRTPAGWASRERRRAPPAMPQTTEAPSQHPRARCERNCANEEQPIELASNDPLTICCGPQEGPRTSAGTAAGWGERGPFEPPRRRPFGRRPQASGTAAGRARADSSSEPITLKPR